MKNNKSNKIIKNLLFVFLVILVIIGICFFNYKMDPYNIFEERDYFFLNDYPRDLINIAIKNYKGPEVDTVLIGSSDSVTMFGDYNKKYFILL